MTDEDFDNLVAFYAGVPTPEEPDDEPRYNCPDCFDFGVIHVNGREEDCRCLVGRFQRLQKTP